MTIFRQIDEFVFIGTFDRGVPNNERFVFRPTRQIRLAEYLICLALRIKNDKPGWPDSFLPIPKYTLWLNHEGIIGPNYWIFVYTGPGDRQMTSEVTTGEPALVLHWGLDHTVLAEGGVEPVIFHLEGILGSSMPTFATLLQNPAPQSEAMNETRLLEMLNDMIEKK